MLLLLYEIAENLTMVKASISHPGMEKIDTSGAYGRFFRRVPSGYASQFKEDSFLFDRPIYELLKRIMDIFGSLCVVLLTIWLYPIIGFFIWFEDGGSVFHIQDRIGRISRGSPELLPERGFFRKRFREHVTCGFYVCRIFDSQNIS